MSLKGDLAPLQTVLNQILGRIQAIENKVGVKNVAYGATGNIEEILDSPAVTAYDKHVETSLEPFIGSIKSLPGLEESSLTNDIENAWAAIGVIVVAGSKCKKPSSLADLTPLLKPAQESIANIRKLRLPREYDNHIKAMMEMLSCLGWVTIDTTSVPPSSSLFVKSCIGSSDFWANKIRKIHKGKEDEVSIKNVQFCDKLKALILDLVGYTKEYHMSGLAWNFNGVEFSKYEPTSCSKSSEKQEPSSASVQPAPTAKKPIEGGGGIMNIKDELEKKKSSMGNSAATGLRKVTKDQQSWRKEYKNDASVKTGNTTSNLKSKFLPKTESSKSANKKTPPPIFEYRDRGSKWAIEYQTKNSTAESNNIINVEVKDSKQHVYLYKCDEVTFIIKGKSNSIVVDTCNKCNVVFDTVISSCEVVNCKKIQAQVKGVCPSFSIDKTDGFLTYLSKESAGLTSFITCKSSEMNVNFPGENDEMKEMPIPEQFQHKVVDGALRSDVSDLYH